MIVVLHAYSDVNLGDGLLVDLTVDRLESLGIGHDRRLIVALDGESFHRHGAVSRFGTPRRSVGPDLAPAALRSTRTLLASRRPSRGSIFGMDASDISGFVAVGGGYLRAGDIVEQIGVSLNHLPQLELAARHPAPAVYLPQSIGPLAGLVGRRIQRSLERVQRLWLRDDTSMKEVRASRRERVPDLAVLDLADRGVEPVAPRTDTVVLIARELDRGRPHYVTRLRMLADRLGARSVWATQATGASEKSDAAFYDQLGVVPAGSTLEVIGGPEAPAAVVSVRLHGALMSIAAGHPTIHLSYQRKGWTAMRDLGLTEFVHDAGDFDVDLVLRQADELSRSPERYWECVQRELRALQVTSSRLTDEMGAALG